MEIQKHIRPNTTKYELQLRNFRNTFRISEIDYLSIVYQIICIADDRFHLVYGRGFQEKFQNGGMVIRGIGRRIVTTDNGQRGGTRTDFLHTAVER